MNIKRLSVENFLRINFVDIEPDGNVIVLTGNNGEGKTSVLNSIWAALANPRVSEMPRPVKDGEEKAIITADIGQYVVTRTFTEKDGERKTTLKVVGAEGAQFMSPQKLLNGLLGELTFDPLAFIEMKEDKQVELLLNLTNSDTDFNVLDNQRQAHYDERTNCNKMVKELSAQRGEEPPKIDKIDLSEIQNQIESSDELRRSIEKQKTNRELVGKKIQELQASLVEIDEYLKKAEPALAKYPPREDLKKQLEMAIENNQKVGDWDKWSEAGKSIGVYSEKANELENKMKDIDEKKRKAIEALKFPYPDLGFGEGGVTYKGLPIKQASKAEQIRISMAIAMAMNPKLKVIRIEDGSLLDPGNLKLIHELADEKEYQVWIERVMSEGEETGILIEDGYINRGGSKIEKPSTDK